jgi:hypothetical protein
MIGVAMVQEWKVITPTNDMSITAIAMVLLVTSVFLAQRAISAIRRQDPINCCATNGRSPVVRQF